MTSRLTLPGPSFGTRLAFKHDPSSAQGLCFTHQHLAEGPCPTALLCPTALPLAGRGGDCSGSVGCLTWLEAHRQTKTPCSVYKVLHSLALGLASWTVAGLSTLLGPLPPPELAVLQLCSARGTALPPCWLCLDKAGRTCLQADLALPAGTHPGGQVASSCAAFGALQLQQQLTALAGYREPPLLPQGHSLGQGKTVSFVWRCIFVCFAFLFACF